MEQWALHQPAPGPQPPPPGKARQDGSGEGRGWGRGTDRDCPPASATTRPPKPGFLCRGTLRGGLGHLLTRLPPLLPTQYGIKKKEEREAEAQAAMEANSEGSLTRPKKAIPPGCGDEPEEEDESILDTVIKYLPGPLQDMFKK